MTEFGASFKKARELRGISLDQIATETRISTRFLTAIEKENFRLLPGGIFNRGFIRTYAGRVGLDPEQAVADYERLTGEAQVETPVIIEPPTNKNNSRLFPIALAALISLIIAVYFLSPSPEANPVTSSQPAVSSAPATNPVTDGTSSSQPTVEPILANAAKTPLEATISRDLLAVELQVHQATWIQLTTDGSQVVNGEILQPGTTRRYTANTSIHLTIGNAGGLTLKLNGQPVRSLGRPRQVRMLTITPDNVADIIG